MSLLCAIPLAAGDIDAARQAVSMIVGRDPARLDEAGIARAAIESLAENTSDGVVAPLFWGALFGLPGIAGYKAINTLDSMIGHRNERHEAFGWAAARIDDVANIIPARLTGLLFALTGPGPRDALLCMVRDARHHRSPNAGWPEAAMAGALGVRLCGPRAYHGELADEPWLNGSARDPAAADISRALECLCPRNADCCRLARVPRFRARHRMTGDHGGNLDVAQARFGGRLEDWIDLSTGINRQPYPVPALALAALERAAVANRYRCASGRGATGLRDRGFGTRSRRRPSRDPVAAATRAARPRPHPCADLQ